MNKLKYIYALAMCLCIALSAQAQNDLSSKVDNISNENNFLKQHLMQIESKIKKQNETNKKQQNKIEKTQLFKEQLSLDLSKLEFPVIAEKYAEEMSRKAKVMSEFQLITNTYILPTEKNEEVFKSVEQMPTFPGGDAALMKYLSSHIQYPTMAQENGIQGKVVVQFVVGKDGWVRDVRVARSVDKELDKEAVRVCKSLPKFTTPGKQNGQAVSVLYTLPITFRLSNDETEKKVKKKKFLGIF